MSKRKLLCCCLLCHCPKRACATCLLHSPCRRPPRRSASNAIVRELTGEGVDSSPQPSVRLRNGEVRGQWPAAASRRCPAVVGAEGPVGLLVLLRLSGECHYGEGEESTREGLQRRRALGSIRRPRGDRRSGARKGARQRVDQVERRSGPVGDLVAVNSRRPGSDAVLWVNSATAELKLSDWPTGVQGNILL
eukprot:scaffold1483_cov159-Pinguiococcus_pyrenoidosus.AAC.2